MRNYTLILVLLCSVLCQGISAADDLETLEATNRLLRAEYELATKTQLYFVFDLSAKKIQFKASGMAIAELPLQRVSFWGTVGGDKVRTVASKHSYKTPERDVLKIPSAEESAKPEAEPKAEVKTDPKKFELAALELSDMPTSFQVRFDDGLLVAVKPAPEEFFRRIWWTLNKGFWYLSRPLVTVWNFLHKRPYSEILLTMPPKDAQLLYWSLTDGSSCLLIN
ncbi:MAG TPA: hypothetical protein VD811_06945 [Desulfuromonadales bacterium]|nr:hypothetical protein [Desulfuromonadales bacterium]